MQLLINRDTGMVTVNGTSYHCDLSALDPKVNAIRWFDDHGEITYNDGRTTGLADIFRFKPIIDQWDEKYRASKAATR